MKDETVQNAARSPHKHGGDLPLTFVVCSNDPDSVHAHSVGNLLRLGPNDLVLVVFDAEETPAMLRVARQLRSERLHVMFSGPSRGLSEARNAAIRSAPTKHVVFIDDDVTIDCSAVEAIRAAFCRGRHIVGVRLRPAPETPLSKWYISASQFHYLGLHRNDAPGKTWGACMGFDIDFVRGCGLEFRVDLGRRGGTLISGEDTSFISELRQLEADEEFLESVHVNHHVAPDRLTLRRMLYRALYQGRSEVRRGNSAAGALKEWKRNIRGWRETPIRTWSLAILYQSMVFIGMIVEPLSSAASQGFSYLGRRREHGHGSTAIALTVEEKPGVDGDAPLVSSRVTRNGSSFGNVKSVRECEDDETPA